MQAKDAAIGGTATSPSADEDGDDWLEGSDCEVESSAPQSMAARDLGKVQRKMYDEGYREGIAAGKEAAIQSGFDVGFTKGSPLGRQLGQLRGTLHAMQSLLNTARQAPAVDSDDAQLRTRDNLRSSIDDLNRRAGALKWTDLAEPDWEAIEHEREHGDDIEIKPREALSERFARDAIVSSLQAEADQLLDRLKIAFLQSI